MYIDSIKAQMQSRYFSGMGTLVEAGVVVVDNDPSGMERGYYYVSMYLGLIEDKPAKIFSVSYESLMDFLYGYSYPDDEYEFHFIERYDSFEETFSSDFAEVFCRLVNFEELAGSKLG